MDTSDNVPKATQREATEVRYSMRGMLIGMAVVAVVTTALGAFIRHFPKDAQPRLAIYWGILAVILMALVAYLARRRFLAEQRAGSVLYAFPTHSYFLPRAPDIATVIAGVLLISIAPMMWTFGSFAIAKDNSFENWWRATNWSAINCTIATGVGITILWWRRVRVAENGLVVRNRFVPWECCYWHWDACNKNVAVIEFRVGNSHGRTTLRMPAEERAAVEALFNEKRATKRFNQTPPKAS